MDAPEIVATYFLSLPEQRQHTMLEEAGIPDPLNWAREDRDPLVKAYLSKYIPEITPHLLRVFDFNDNEIRALVNFGVRAELDQPKPAVSLRFSLGSGMTLLDRPLTDRSESVRLAELAGAAAVSAELVNEVARLADLFGVDVEPPVVRVSEGSAQLAIGGGLLAAGVAFLVAAATPIAIGGGAVLASAGLMDLLMSWRERDANIAKSNIETEKTSYEIEKLRGETEKLRLENEKMAREASQGLIAPASAALSPATITNLSRRYGLEPVFGTSLLNRALPTMLAAKAYYPSIAIDHTGAAVSATKSNTAGGAA